MWLCAVFTGGSDGGRVTGMPPRLLPCFLPGCLVLLACLVVVGVHGSDEECLGPSNTQIYCYDCTADSDDHFCGDPFNKTHPDLEKVRCRAFCVKWSRTTLSGRTYYQRTCSDKLHIAMRKSVVCIEESRPSQGQLCFCDKDRCNHGTTPTAATTLVFLALFVTLLVSNLHLR